MYAGRNLAYQPSCTTVKSSTCSNDIFAVNVDYTRDKMMLRDILERHFRPVFQKFVYGGEQMAIHDLRRLLQDPAYRRHIPDDKLFILADLVAFNPNISMPYDVFVKIVLEGDDSISLGSSLRSESHHDRRGRHRGCLDVIVTNTSPQKEIDEFLPKFNCCPPPFFMITITLVQIIMYVVDAVQLNDDDVAITALEGVAVNSSLIYTPAKRHEAWRFLTYMFIHQGYVDLLFNMIIQVVVGFPLEVVFSWWRLAVVYLCGVLTGSLLQSVSDHHVGLVGSSGGAYAILTTHVISMIYNYSELNNNPHDSKCWRRACNVPLRILVILLLVVVQTGLGVYRRFFSADILNMGIAGYGGGIIAGFLLAKPFMKDRRRYPWQQNAGWLDLFIFVAFVGGCVVFNIVYRGYPDTVY